MPQKKDADRYGQGCSRQREFVRQKHDSGVYARQYDEQATEHGVYEELTAEAESPKQRSIDKSRHGLDARILRADRLPAVPASAFEQDIA